MSAHDQCPSSVKKGMPGKAALAEMSRASGRAAPWRSLDEVADTPEFRDQLEREFPSGASELLEPTTRRSFLQLMGASVALAGVGTLAGCRRPNHKIMPYAAKVPEEIIPGKPLFYATSMAMPGGGAEGLLVETHEGRPTKVEGNPLHKTNRGKSSVWAQASVLSLYDPDRLRGPYYTPTKKAATWDDFKAWAKDHFSAFDRSKGDGLAFLVDKKDSPSRDAMKARVMTRFPKAMWVPYDSADADGAVSGAQAALGGPVKEQITIHDGAAVRAKVIVSLDRDFLDQSDPNNLVHQRQWGAARRVIGTKDPMTRLYVVESGLTNTGSCGDHRLRLAPSRIAAFAVQLAKAVGARVGGQGGSALAAAVGAVQGAEGPDIPKDWVESVADDLVAEELWESGKPTGKRTRASETLVLAGPTQPAAVHALVHAINDVLGNVGKTIGYLPMSADLAANSGRGIADLTKAMQAGTVTTLVCVNVNPVYDAPADLKFAEAMARVTSVTLGIGSSETATASTWILNGAHELESWGDTRSWDGTVAPIQPMIAPLYDPARSDIEFLAVLSDPNAAIVAEPPKPAAGAAPAAAPAPSAAAAPAATQAAPTTPRVDDGYVIVRQAWAAALKMNVQGADFEKAWKRALHDGIAPFPEAKAETRQVNHGAVAAEVAKLTLNAAPTSSAMEVVFATTHLHDGRFASNPWLHELPQVGTRVVWENPALVSPGTARELGLLPEGWSDKRPGQMYTHAWPRGQKATITIAGRAMDLAVWILPGMADHTVILHQGFGRTVSGRVADGVGFNVNLVRESTAGRVARGATMKPLHDEHRIASTQNHWSMEGRTSIVREVDLVAWQKHGDAPREPRVDRIYGEQLKAAQPLNFAEKIDGELSHTPPNVNIYPHPFTEDREGAPKPGSSYSTGPQWGMSIDLSSCTGCGTCTIACQAENNIPVVGKNEVAKNREMHWIRVDRYFVGDIDSPTSVLLQPVPCMQCENAPCETVCPVNATVHGTEGINYQVYNRCIGTRYCENNCPYKVRRFNFFDYGVTKFNGDYIGKENLEAVMPDRGGITGSGVHNKVNPNLIPPRLRQKLDQIERMQKNPDVTVRSRGVMEKCTYCIQRLNEARIEMKLHEIKGMPDGFVQTACQQACPTDAIVFGDRLDSTSDGGKGSRVKQMQENQRTYMLLGYLNTRPRTTYMVRVNNPNPRLRMPEENPFHHGSEGGGHEPAGHGGEAKGHAEMDRSTFIRQQTKAVADKGYALSLRVLSSIGL